MSCKEMQVVNVKSGGQGRVAFEAECELASIANGPWILVPDEIQHIAVTFVNTDTAGGKVQTTINIVDDVKNDSGVIAVDWDLGEVTEIVQDVCVPVTAIRLVQTTLGGGSGTTKIFVRAQ